MQESKSELFSEHGISISAYRQCPSTSSHASSRTCTASSLYSVALRHLRQFFDVAEWSAV